jgi:glycosyltransferase involved in cell wall biosynthesis
MMMVSRPTASSAVDPVSKTQEARGGGPYLLVSGDFVETGGMDRCNHALATYLADRGAEVHLVAHRVADDLRRRPNVFVRQVPKPLGSYFLGGPLLDRVGRREAARVTARGGRVVVNGGNCRFGDVNWVHYVHAVWAPPRGPGGLARRLKAVLARRLALSSERLGLTSARLVLANSERTRRDVIERFGLDPTRVHAVYLGVDAARFQPPSEAERSEARVRLGWADERPAVAFVGAPYDPRKGFDTLFAAWRRLAGGRGPSWEARLVVLGGDGAGLESWRTRVKDAGLADSIQFLGLRRDVPAVLAACDALASPTRYEAYGLGVQEALCRGLPAYVSADAGVAEHYGPDLSHLLLPDPEDAEDLADRLRAWRDRPAADRPAVAALSHRLRQNTWARMSAQIATLIEFGDGCGRILS